MKVITVGLALLDFAPVFFLSVGLFFLAQLVDRLDPRCRRMAQAGFALVTIASLGRVTSNLLLSLSGVDLPLLTTSFYVFAGPGSTLMGAALIRGKATANGRIIDRDPWLLPAGISWLFLGAAWYLSGSSDGGGDWRVVLAALSLFGMATTCAAAAALGWARRLHMAAGLFAFSVGALVTQGLLRLWSPQNPWIQLVGESLHIAGQAAFAFAAWRVAAEYHARIGPTAAT